MFVAFWQSRDDSQPGCLMLSYYWDVFFLHQTLVEMTDYDPSSESFDTYRRFNQGRN